MNNKFNLILLAIIVSLFIPDLTKLGKQFTNKSLSPTLDQVKIQSRSPSPTPLVIKPAEQYLSKELQISITIPKGSFHINYDKTKSWGTEFSTEYAYTKHLEIEDLKTRRLYNFYLASIENDVPFSWEGSPGWYVPSLSANDSTDELMSKLTRYGQSPTYVKNIQLNNLNTFARIIYTKNCYGMCRLERKYLIPFEKNIGGNIYHTLAFTTVVAELGSSDQDVASSLEKIETLIPFDNYSDPELQQAITIQDQIVNSLVFN